jgi:hypothetical protein
MRANTRYAPGPNKMISRFGAERYSRMESGMRRQVEHLRRGDEARRALPSPTRDDMALDTQLSLNPGS